MRRHHAVLSLLLALVLCLGLLSVGALGSGEAEAVPETDEALTEEAAVPADDRIEENEPIGEAPDEETEAPDEEPADVSEAEPAEDGAPGGGGNKPGSGDQPGSGGGSSSVSWKGASTITSGTTVTDGEYASSTDQQNALLIDTKDDVTLENPTATKTGAGGNSDNYSFYGINAAIMVKGGTTTTINGGTIYTTAAGANGVFSYGGNGGKNDAAGDGTTVIISDTRITTTADSSGGIMTTGGGVTYAYNLDITTSGGSSAPIRTDRGGGTVVVDGGTYTSTGLGSPAIYSTATISVKNATLESKLSEGVCIEGKNSITLENCDLTANNTSMNGKAQFLDTIMIYQSMSGDANSGTSSFTMTGGSLTSKSGHVFHVTNTNAIITLSGVEIRNEYDTDYPTLLSVCADGWSGGKNIATLNADAQTLTGGILVGSDATLTLNLKNGSTYTGYFYGVITNYKGTQVSSSLGTVNVTLDATSKLYLQADADIASFSGDPANVVTNGHTLYVKGVALEGTTESEDEDPAETPELTDANEDGNIDAADAAWYLKENEPLKAAAFLRGIIKR